MPRDDAVITAITSPPGKSLGAVDTGISEAQVYAAISDVLDPELDEPLVKLGFIDRVQVDGPDVMVAFKLPTYWCAPNFAYLMAADLRARVRALPGVRTARVVLLDHCAEEEINSGINQGQSFAEAFAGEAHEDADLEELRRTFLRKGFLMRQDTLLRQALKARLDEATILTLHVADLLVDEMADIALLTTPGGIVQLAGAGRNAGVYLRKRVALGLPCGENELLITNDQGQPIAPGGLQDYLRRSRSVRLNIMFNTSMCKGLFRTRYENAGAEEAHREGDIL
jgi:metal-sulfur cluster biosynthetic enzyme